jgi:hypothetical protein
LVHSDREKPKSLERKLCQCHNVHDKSQIHLLGIEQWPHSPATNLLKRNTEESIILVCNKYVENLESDTDAVE